MGLRTSIRILGSGASLPATAVTREALDARLGLLPGTLADYGAARLRYVTTDETAAGLAARACEQALAASGLAWQDIDCLVAANATMDQGLPYNASLIHAQLGLQRHPIASFDVGASCLSFLNALDIVGHLLHNRRYRNVMLVSADIATFGLNWKELRECGNFGDGAAAVVLRRSAPDEASCIRTASFRTLSQGVHFCEIPAGGSRFHPERIRQPFEPLTKFSMDGKAVMTSHGQFAGMVGKDTLDMTDAAGRSYRHDIVAIKTAGWVDYLFQRAQSDEIEPKSSYCVRALPDDIVCVGAYKT